MTLGESAEPSLAEINQEMNELLDEQVNEQKEKTSRVHTSSCKATIVCDKIQETQKMTGALKC